LLAGLLAATVAFLPEHPYLSGRDVLQPPGTEHWLGTNGLGQDVLTGLVAATPSTILICLFASFLMQGTALIFALLAVTCGRGWSTVILRIVDILQAVPQILVLLLLAAWFWPDVTGLVAILALTGWHDDVRVLRSLILREMRRENVRYARVMGAGWAYCSIHHTIPALWPSVTGLYVQNLRHAALRTAGLGLLGLADPRLLTWGGMMKDALPHLYMEAWLWLLLPPAFCLSLFLLGVLALGRLLDKSAPGRVG
tara:strand:+ start:2464 stop:3225 length:762 start_codon:yes stop_codon:yes gene_type:complete